MPSHDRVQLFVSLWTVAHQAACFPCGVFQATILEWVAVFLSGSLPSPGIRIEILSFLRNSQLQQVWMVCEPHTGIKHREGRAVGWISKRLEWILWVCYKLPVWPSGVLSLIYRSLVCPLKNWGNWALLLRSFLTLSYSILDSYCSSRFRSSTKANKASLKLCGKCGNTLKEAKAKRLPFPYYCEPCPQYGCYKSTTNRKVLTLFLLKSHWLLDFITWTFCKN